MKVAFRADASKVIGTGHVMRCLALAEEFRNRNHEVVFYLRESEGTISEIVDRRGFKLVTLAALATPLVPKSSDDYAAWLQVSEEQDADDFCASLDFVDLVIVDHYGIGMVWEERVKTKLNCKLVALDDLVREHRCDMLVDQTLGRDALEYKTSVPTHSRILAGVEFSILRQNFVQYREQVIETGGGETSNDLLITMGGVDSKGVTKDVLQALEKEEFHGITSITVIISPNSPFYEAAKKFIGKYPQLIAQYDFVENIAELMCSHTISIGAPGTTSWERACLGLPSIVVPIANNQLNVAKQLAKHGLAQVVEVEDLSEQLKIGLRKLSENYSEYRKRCLKAVDGAGANRVVSNIEQMMGRDEGCLKNIRFATSNDISLVHEWQSLPETRQFALNSQVPDIAEHTLWMQKKLQSYDNFFYLMESEDESGHICPCGVVRLDRTDLNQYTVSIFVEPTFFGKGIAKNALLLIGTYHPYFAINATVLTENLASQKLFAGAGYERLDNEHFIRPALRK